MDSPNKTGLELGATIGLGNYSSIRVTVWAEQSAGFDIASAQDVLYEELLIQLHGRLSRLLEDLHTRGWVTSNGN